ncbi:hypothetical protein SAMN02745146_3178 [Hymenobacter daecheongensis DSM 21074]|uniref:Uncharacterized protein n=1 Tax=Hymenobacter daecheongensis DSM 21074 TaxID=1121955 RepID=A0A1M6JL17_9BACT|nr:hypothetical protein [Hymenobacter daecheongensis]SHJ47355.1 hypothetical protein SAMN02745146_3178 [Hymenobacter daecheongensis DSM 21074]
MNRNLVTDATQVSLGDSSTLTLELSTEAAETSLSKALSGPDAKGSLYLAFDNLTSDAQVQGFNFDYKVEKDLLIIKPRSVMTGGDLFSKLRLLTDKISLKSLSSVTIEWQVDGWEQEGTYHLTGHVRVGDNGENRDFGPEKLQVAELEAERPVRVTLGEASREDTSDEGLWDLIKRRTLDFNRYRAFIDSVLCNVDSPNYAQIVAANSRVPFNRLASYAMLRHATELYLMQEAGLAVTMPTFPLPGGGGNLNLPPRRSSAAARRLSDARRSLSELREEYLQELEKEEGRVLPYFNLIKQKLSEVPLKTTSDLGGLGPDVCYGILKSKLEAPPLLELIWSYWHEEGGLVQTMNAISLRFQNVRQHGRGQDPLAGLNIDPLRPLSNLIWGYIEDERNRLTLNRRNLEYQYEYGIGLIGRAVQTIPVAEHRTFFLRGFHSLLRAATEFYQQANFTTVIPDGFPVLNHLREVHLVLAEGAHNQYGDLPWTARAEMLVQQWLLARPEMREFLGGRVMVPYTEPWMDRVDNMKQLQGWNPANVSHFHDLGTFGEQLLLSIRYGSWNDPSVGAANAANWAHSWRHAIQRYIHAYKAVTGVDLASDIVDARLNLPDNEERYLEPAQLIERQTAMQQQQLRRNQRLSGPMASPNFGQALPGRVPLPRGNGFLE